MTDSAASVGRNPTSAACCLVHQLGKCDAVFTCCDRCPTFFADRAKPIYGKPFHGWSCDCDECKGHDERGEPRPGEAPRPQASAAPLALDVDPWDETPVSVPRGLLALLLDAAGKADEARLLGDSCPSDPCPYCTALVEIYEAVYPIGE